MAAHPGNLQPRWVHSNHVFRISFSYLVSYTTSNPINMFTFSVALIMLTLWTVLTVSEILIQYLHTVLAAQCRASTKAAALVTRNWVTPVSRSRSLVLAFVICNWKCTTPAPSGLAKTDTVIHYLGYIFRWAGL